MAFYGYRSDVTCVEKFKQKINWIVGCAPINRRGWTFKAIQVCFQEPRLMIDLSHKLTQLQVSRRTEWYMHALAARDTRQTWLLVLLTSALTKTARRPDSQSERNFVPEPHKCGIDPSLNSCFWLVNIGFNYN